MAKSFFVVQKLKFIKNRFSLTLNESFYLNLEFLHFTPVRSRFQLHQQRHSQFHAVLHAVDENLCGFTKIFPRNFVEKLVVQVKHELTAFQLLLANISVHLKNRVLDQVAGGSLKAKEGMIFKQTRVQH